MDKNGSHCEEVKADKNYPLTQLPLQCPPPTPSEDTTYRFRNFINEDEFVITGTFEPINSQTPTPTYTPTYTPTPGITPTQTLTPFASPTPTKTLTPTATPPPTVSNTHNPRYVFILEIDISIDIEVVVYFDLITKTLNIYHAVEGAFPKNPIYLQWVVLKDGVIISQGQDYWTIPWRLTPAAAPRLNLFGYKEDAAEYAMKAALYAAGGAAAVGIVVVATEMGLGTFTTAGAQVLISLGPVALAIGIAVGLVVFALMKLFGGKKPPPPRPYPQYSNTYQLPPGLIIPINNFKLNPGSIPAHVYDGGIAVEVPPTSASRYIAAIDIIDRTPTRASTTDSYKFQISTSNY